MEESLTVNKDIINNKVGKLEEEIKKLEKLVNKNDSDIKEKLRIQQDYNNKINEIEEQVNEIWQGTDRNLRQVLQNNLNITNIHIERTHRVSRKEKVGSETFNSKRRTILAKLLCYQNKEEIMRGASNLKETNFYVYEDFLRETQSRRARIWK